jgi:hypothetical protein
MALNYPGGYITKSPPTPTSTSAPGIWTLEQAMQYIKAGTWPTPPIGDPYWQYTALLSGTGSTNGAQNSTFLDSSTNNFTLTRNGNATQGTFTPFSAPSGYWGNYFDGSGDYLSVAANAAFNFGTGDFTVEFWINYSDPAGAQTVFDIGYTSAPNMLLQASSGAMALYVNGASNIIGSGATDITGQWNHYAVVRSGSTITMYRNGVSVGTTSYSGNVGNSSSTVYVGGSTGGGGYYVNGYLSNFRVVKGTAVYTSTFTPPTSPLTAITNTSLLTCQSNRFVDNSTNAFAITSTGNTKTLSFAPFGNTELYTTTNVGGSGYFDADADYVQTSTTSSDFQFTGDFTIEGWFYPNGTALDAQPFGQNYSGGGVQLYVNANGSIEVAYGVASQFTTSAGAVVKGQWNHIALTRSGTTVRCMVNGVSVGSTTTSGTIGATTAFAIGARSGGGYVCDGYVSSVRVVNGTAVYTGSTYTIPTAPVTAIANTKLLCNFTNAGIYDQAAENNFETVGNAQVSTSVKKYGNGSMYFDGVGDRLYRFNSPLYNFGTGDFTVECWVYVAANTSYATLIDFSADGGGGYGWFLEYSSTRGVLFYMGTGGGNSNITAESLPLLTTWTHVAVTRSNGYAKIFINGTQVAGASLTSSSVSAEPLTIGSSKNGTYPLNGYLSDVRITKGLARYTYNFTPPVRAMGAFFQAQAVPVTDPYFDYTSLLLPGSGTNGAQNNTFLDSSTNAFSITRNGNTTQGTFSPFSQTGWSNYFDGTGDYLSRASNSAYLAGTGDFTFELFINATSVSPLQGIVDIGFNSGGYGFYLQSGELRFRTAAGDLSSFITPNQWNHVAACRSGSTLTLYLNGAKVASAANSSNISTASTTFIGCFDTAGSYPFTGYLSNLRIVKGTALYTGATYTVPTSTLTAVSGTGLLTCQSNRIVDNSSNAFALTVNGNTSAQVFAPFNPTAAYSAATNGGSGYFDGTGDYLETPSNSAFTLGSSGNFTVECWAYLNGNQSGSYAVLMTTFADFSNSYTNRWAFTVDGVSLRWYDSSGNVGISTNLKVYEWTHIAAVRNGSTITLYINGTSVGTQTSNQSYTDIGSVKIGYLPAAAYFNGYITDARVVKGTAVYTSNFTPPTAPLTAIANTSLLCNFTNAGIYDATAKNNLETVGNAQISNTIAKWGSTSMYFDGSGDSLTLPNSFNFRAGDWTIECWIYFNTSVISKTWFVQNNGTQFYTSNTGLLRIDTKVSGADKRITGTTQLVTGQWYHVAATRYGATQMLFLNGQLEGTFNLGTSSLDVRTDPTSIGSSFEGYIQDMRVTTGIARYTSNFTPPTAAFQLL